MAPAVAYPWAVPTASGITIPGLPAVTGRIHVDQFGYLPAERKTAIISDPQIGYNADESYTPGPKLELRRVSDGVVVCRGEPKLYDGGKTDRASGDRGWWFDFSKVTAVGDYYVFDPKNNRRSHVLRIAPDVYHGVLRAAVRVYFYQREAFAHQPPYAEAPWLDEASYLQDRQARAISAKDDPTTVRDLSGGWMDAGDTNKYPTFLPEVIHPLLYAWRANPAAFTDDFGLPESGNGLPDLLDEVKYELDWLMKMQDADGGVFIKMGGVSQGGGWPPSADHHPRFYGPKASASTLATAGIFAHAARVYRQFNEWKPFADELGRRAALAWQWYRAHPRTYEVDDGEIKSGDADKTAEEQDRGEALAAAHLWALTGQAEYHEVFRQRFAQTRQMKEPSWSPYEAGQMEALLDYTRLPGADRKVVKRILGQLRDSTRLAAFMPQDETSDLYRAWVVPTSHHWGSNIVRTAYGQIAFDALAYVAHGVPKTKLRQRALDLLHSMHGVNPNGIVYLTNMGREGAEVSASRIWHDWFPPTSPLAAQPAPGYVVGGPNHSYTGTLEWLKHQPDSKCYADFNEGWPANSWEITEPGIYYQALYVRLLANFARPGIAGQR